MATSIGGIVLHKVLNDPHSSLEVWTKLKLSFFGAEFTSIFSEITRFYNKHNFLPTFEELRITVRNKILLNNINALQALEVPEEVELELAVEALINEFTQNETLNKLDSFVEKITLYDTEEIKENLAQILLHLEEKTHISEEIVLMSDINLIDEEDMSNRIMLGINNTFDASTGGVPPTELIMPGGMRGSGKSIFCNNIVNNQYEQGNVGLYFSIEMRAREVITRSISSLAGVSHAKLRLGKLSTEEFDKVALVRKNMFMDSDDLYSEYLTDRNYKKLDSLLIKTKQLKPTNQIVVVDNQRLSLVDIDMNLQKFKAQFKDKLQVVVVDYVNQIEIEDIYNWKSQISLSKGLKNLARKYDVVMIAPYQVDKTLEARFSKGILDAADIALVLTPHSDYINFKSTKTRNIPAFEFNTPMDWSTLKMYPTDYALPESEEDTPDRKFTRKSDDMEF